MRCLGLPRGSYIALPGLNDCHHKVKTLSDQVGSLNTIKARFADVLLRFIICSCHILSGRYAGIHKGGGRVPSQAGYLLYLREARSHRPLKTHAKAFELERDYTFIAMGFLDVHGSQRLGRFSNF